MNMSLEVIVSEPTPDALAYAHALERRGAHIVTPKAIRQLIYHGHKYNAPYVITRPYDYEGHLRDLLPPSLDAEMLDLDNIGRISSGLLCAAPPICQAVEEWLDSYKKWEWLIGHKKHSWDDLDAIVVVGHGLGSIIAAYLARRNNASVIHTKTEEAPKYINLPTINASRTALPGKCVLQLPLNPPKFSRRLVDLVVERAASIEKYKCYDESKV